MHACMHACLSIRTSLHVPSYLSLSSVEFGECANISALEAKWP